jgi:hypothetical protein
MAKAQFGLVHSTLNGLVNNKAKIEKCITTQKGQGVDWVEKCN